MNSVIICILFSLVSTVLSDSFVDVGCKNPVTKGSYKPMDYWTSHEDRCYNCVCLEQKQVVAFCVEEALFQKKAASPFQQQNGIFNRFIPKNKKGHVNPAVLRQIEIEVTEEKALTIKCKPTPKPYLDEATGNQIFPRLRMVTYVYKKLISQCARRTSIPVNIPEECKVQKVNNCDYKVVTKANVDKLCNKPYDLV